MILLQLTLLRHFSLGNSFRAIVHCIKLILIVVDSLNGSLVAQQKLQKLVSHKMY